MSECSVLDRVAAVIGGRPVAVALSGGVDSSVLLAAAVRSSPEVVAVTARSPSQRESDVAMAGRLARDLGVDWVVADTDELSDPRYRANGPDRCYVCKLIIMSAVQELARTWGCGLVVEGSTVDDRPDDRPGMAALRELGIVSPLQAAGVSKDEVRTVARTLGLPTADRPSSGCLATRIVGQEISVRVLEQVGRAEAALETLGLGRTGPLRVRHHGELARIQVGESDLSLVTAEAKAVREMVQSQGFSRVCLDLAPYGME